jgi:hypothetical protein
MRATMPEMAMPTMGPMPREDDLFFAEGAVDNGEDVGVFVTVTTPVGVVTMSVVVELASWLVVVVDKSAELVGNPIGFMVKKTTPCVTESTSVGIAKGVV